MDHPPKTEANSLVSSSNSKKADFIHIYFLGVATVVCGVYVGWNIALKMGFYQYLGCVLFIGSGFFCMCLCLCEMNATFPFSGGTYGVARVTLGKFPAYLMGMFEFIEYMNCAIFATQTTDDIIIEIFGQGEDLRLLVWVVIYLSLTALQFAPRKVFWCQITVFGVFTLTMAMIYVFGTPNYANYHKYITTPSIKMNEQQNNHSLSVFTHFPHAMWFFFGVETLPLVSGDAKHPNKTIPKAIMAVFVTSLVMTIAVLFTSCAIYPGVSPALWFSQLPMTTGFSMIFGVKIKHALIFSMIVQYPAAQGFITAYTRQLVALHKSKLLLEMLPESWKQTHEFIPPILFGTLITLIIMSVNAYTKVLTYLPNSILIASCFLYMGVFACYIEFRKQFNTLAKRWRSRP